jgi:hypothetical protein
MLILGFGITGIHIFFIENVYKNLSIPEKLVTIAKDARALACQPK